MPSSHPFFSIVPVPCCRRDKLPVDPSFSTHLVRFLSLSSGTSVASMHQVCFFPLPIRVLCRTLFPFLFSLSSSISLSVCLCFFFGKIHMCICVCVCFCYQIFLFPARSHVIHCALLSAGYSALCPLHGGEFTLCVQHCRHEMSARPARRRCRFVVKGVCFPTEQSLLGRQRE